MLEENLDYQLPVKNNINIASLGIYKFISERKEKKEESKTMQKLAICCGKNYLLTNIKGHSVSIFHPKKYLQFDILDIMDIFFLFCVRYFSWFIASKVQDMY